MEIKEDFYLPLEIDWDMLTLWEMDALLSKNNGYIDGDKKKIVVMVKLKEK